VKTATNTNGLLNTTEENKKTGLTNQSTLFSLARKNVTVNDLITIILTLTIKIILLSQFKWRNIMIALHPEYIINNNAQKKAVIIKFNEWENILAEMEELDDIRAYDIAKTDKDDEIIPFEQAIMEIRA
jgi:hypothetical protein